MHCIDLRSTDPFFNLAIEELVDSFWHTFCDKYIEATKARLYFKLPVEGEADESAKKEIEIKLKEKAGAKETLKTILKTYLKLFHPFIPFITEALWQHIKAPSDSETIMHSLWPGRESL